MGVYSEKRGEVLYKKTQIHPQEPVIFDMIVDMNKVLRLKNDRQIRFERMEMMGIVNVTPDSFYEGSRMGSLAKAIELAERHIAEGAVMIDVGGESTRPGSDPVEADEEIARICPVIEEIRKRHSDIAISADTYRAETAAAAFDAGADIINDISSLTFEPEVGRIVAEAGGAVILMHTPERPKTMQDEPHYYDVVAEVYEFLKSQAEYALSCGIERDRIMVDVGIGFGKNDEHNLALLRNIERFNELGYPQLLAVSRKSLIGRTLAGAAAGPANAASEPLPASDRLAGTLAITAYAAHHGLAAARVHDVKENLQAARMAEAIDRGLIV